MILNTKLYENSVKLCFSLFHGIFLKHSLSKSWHLLSIDLFAIFPRSSETEQVLPLLSWFDPYRMFLFSYHVIFPSYLSHTTPSTRIITVLFLGTPSVNNYHKTYVFHVLMTIRNSNNIILNWSLLKKLGNITRFFFLTIHILMHGLRVVQCI